MKVYPFTFVDYMILKNGRVVWGPKFKHDYYESLWIDKIPDSYYSTWFDVPILNWYQDGHY